MEKFEINKTRLEEIEREIDCVNESEDNLRKLKEEYEAKIRQIAEQSLVNTNMLLQLGYEKTLCMDELDNLLKVGDKIFFSNGLNVILYGEDLPNRRNSYYYLCEIGLGAPKVKSYPCIKISQAVVFYEKVNNCRMIGYEKGEYNETT